VVLEEVYRVHAPFVWRTLRRHGLSETDAQDASQEVFLAVHRALPSFEGRCSMTTWLYTICRSVARDWRGRACRRREVPDAGETAAASRADQTPHSVIEERQRFAVLLRLLSELDAEQREVFALHELEAMSAREIAAALALPEGTVASRLRLARVSFQRACRRHQSAASFVAQRLGVAR